MAKWAYYVNGVKQTFVRRVLPTKTFAACATVVLGSAIAAVEGTIGWRAAMSASGVSVAVILLRAAMTKIELAQAAANPDLKNVEAVQK